MKTLDKFIKNTTKDAELKSEKKTYKSPRLTEFGNVAELTQSGGAGAPDFSSAFPT